MRRFRGFLCLVTALALVLGCAVPQAFASGSYPQAKLKMRVSTRSGPGTEYDEPGTFFSGNWQRQTVTVMGKHWDGNIWWVLIDFSSGNQSYRVWTGLKRVSVNLDAVPEIRSIGQGTVGETETRRGPGSRYAAGPKITHWQDVVAYGWENGYVEVEYRDYDRNTVYRVWVPESAVSIDALVPGSDGEYYNLIN